jgi:hypothetical protein
MKNSAYTLVSCSAYFSTLKMEAICSSETSHNFQLTTRSYVPEDRTSLLRFSSQFNKITRCCFRSCFNEITLKVTANMAEHCVALKTIEAESSSDIKFEAK